MGMASYSIFPRPEQPPADQGAASRAHSRFVEGSMNDRVSNAPPQTFLGPDDIAAYERQFYVDTQTRSRPISGSQLSFSKISGNGFWEGLREKLRISTTKSSSSIITVSSNKSKKSNRSSQQGPAVGGGAQDKENMAQGYYPSREEVVENYKNLVDAGFFSSHAIHGTRHQIPPSRIAPPNAERPLPAPPPPAREAPSVPFSQVVFQRQQEIRNRDRPQTKGAAPLSSSAFASIPYSAIQPSPTGDAPLGTHARPDPRPPLSLPKKYRQPHVTTIPRPPPVSPHRGTKRAMADMTGGSDATMAGVSGNGDNAEAGARKLVKKLRKSASRISADLSLRPMTSSGQGSTNPYGLAFPGGGGRDVRGTASSSAVDLVPRPPLSSAGRAMGVVRSLSNSFKRDGGSKMAFTAGAVAVGNEAVTTTAAPTTTAPPPNKLSKTKRSLSRRVSLSRSRTTSISSSAPITIPGELAPPVAQQRQEPQTPVIPYVDPEPSSRASTTSAPQQQAEEVGDPMVVDSDAEPPTRNASLDVQPGGLSVPSFHYPQRQKVVPLAVVPDANRGIPVVPAIPHHFAGKSGHMKNGSFCFGTGAGNVGISDLGLGEDQGEKENFGVF